MISLTFLDHAKPNDARIGGFEPAETTEVESEADVKAAVSEHFDVPASEISISEWFDESGSSFDEGETAMVISRDGMALAMLGREKDE